MLSGSFLKPRLRIPYGLIRSSTQADTLQLLGPRHTWMLEFSSTTGNEGPLQRPRRPQPPGGGYQLGSY